MFASHTIDPAEQMRCVLCGALFLIADESARLSQSQATRLRLRPGDPMCHRCWIENVLTDNEGRCRFVTGHA